MTQQHQVSWASVLSPTAPPTTPKPQCNDCEKLQHEIQTLRAEIQTLKTLITKQTQQSTPMETPAPITPEPIKSQAEPEPAGEKKRKLETVKSQKTGEQNNFITKEEFHKGLSQIQETMQEQLPAIAAQLEQIGGQFAQLAEQNQNLIARVERLERQQQTTTNRLARREKPYSRPETNDTASADSNNTV